MLRTPDPMAENQTEQTIITLMNGDADVKTRDHALAAALSSMQKLIMKVNQIDSNLWRPQDLEKIIDERHKIICESCPLRKYAQKQQSPNSASESDDKRKPWWTVVTSPVVMMFFLALLAMFVATYALVGRQGFEDVTHAMQVIPAK